MGVWIGKFRSFMEETMEEMRKCAWPPRDQLLESTLLVIVALIVLSGFVAVVDKVLFLIINYVATA